MDISKLAPVFQSVINEEKISKKKRKLKETEATNSPDTVNEIDENNILTALENHRPPEPPNLESIKSKILNNEYEVDYERLAQSLLKIESFEV